MRAVVAISAVLAAALAMLVGLTVLAVVVIAGTEPGTRWALARAEGVLAGQVSVGEVAGRLGGELVLRDVTLRAESLELDVARARLAWSPAALFSSRLQVDALAAEGVRYLALPTPEAPPPEEPTGLPERIDLPVAVVVDDLALSDLQIFTGPEVAEPLEVDRVRLTARFADSRLGVADLELDAPWLTARGVAGLTAAGPYPLTADLTWRATLPGYAPLPGRTRLDGSLEALEIRQRLDAPYPSELTARLENLLAADLPLALSADLAIDELELAAVSPDLPQAQLTLTAAVNGPVTDLEVQAEASGVDPEGRRFRSEVRALVTPEAVRLERLQVVQPGREGRLSGTGRVALAEGMTADLEVAWEALQWPLTGEPTVTSPRGTLTFQGPLDDYRLALDTRLEAPDQPPLALRLSGEGDTESAVVELDSEIGGGTLAGRLAARWTPELDVSGEISARDLDPGAFAADWPGRIDATLVASAERRGDDFGARIERLDADGVLRDRPLTLAAQGEFRQQGGEPRVDIADLALSLGGTELSASGEVGERSDVRWRLASEDLSALLPAAEGRIQGSGTVSGAYPRLQVAATLTGRGLALGADRLASLDLGADLDLTGDTRSSLQLSAADGSLGGTALETVTLEGAGTPDEHRLTLQARAAGADVRAALAGGFENLWGDAPLWRFVLNDARLTYGELAPWQLVEAGAGRVGAGRTALERQCWTAEQAELCFRAAQADQALTASFDLTRLALEYFQPLLPEDVGVSGGVSASGQLQRSPAGVLTARAELATTEGRIRLPEIPGTAPGARTEPAALGFEPSTVRLALGATEAQVEADLRLEHGTLALAAVTPVAVPRAGDPSRTAEPVEARALSGTLQLDIPDLAFVGRLVPALEDMSGRVAGTLGIEGTVDDPAITGELTLAEGSVALPDAGITLSELRVTLAGRGRDGIALDADAASGGGTLALDGLMTLLEPVPKAQLAVGGEDFQILHTEEARIFMTPELEMAATEERIFVGGTVRIPRAEITPGPPSPTAVTVSGDQVLLTDEPGEDADPGRPLYAEIRLVLGDQVSFSGFGLKAGIEGEVLVNQAPEFPATATGELRIVDGEYRAYGQGLVIETGRIFFAGGPVTQPALDIRAVRRPQEGILVGAHVQGTLEDPEFSLFSEPSMTEQEQLAYLVLGRSLQDTPDGEQSALAQAALALGLRGGDVLAQSLGEQLGVDQLAVQTGPEEAGAESDPNAASLVVGKYLSPKLYVSYGIGLFNPENVLQMQYDISRSWRFVTESSGEATGADLLWTIEAGDD